MYKLHNKMELIMQSRPDNIDKRITNCEHLKI